VSERWVHWNKLPFLERLQELQKAAIRGHALKTPGMAFVETQDVGIGAVEAFLKKRRGESIETYSRRIGRWLAEGSPETNYRFVKLAKRPAVEYDMVLVTLSLEEFRLKNGYYPESLKELEIQPQIDLFSNLPMHYRRGPRGFTYWGVGHDLKDDNGDKNLDFVIQSEKGPR
jgi:hypothetical protein